MIYRIVIQDSYDNIWCCCCEKKLLDYEPALFDNEYKYYYCDNDKCVKSED